MFNGSGTGVVVMLATGKHISKVWKNLCGFLLIHYLIISSCLFFLEENICIYTFKQQMTDVSRELLKSRCLFENRTMMLKLRLPVLHPETTSAVNMLVQSLCQTDVTVTLLPKDKGQ